MTWACTMTCFLLCPPRWFYIVVVPIDRVGGSMLTPRWSTPEELELDEVRDGAGQPYHSPVAVVSCGPSGSPKLESLSGAPLNCWQPGSSGEEGL